MTPLLELNNLTVGYGLVDAVHQVSLRIFSGQVVTVIGPNGAGKTTLLNAIAGLLRAKAGDIAFQGKQVADRPVEDRVEGGISLVPEERGLFGDMTVIDNLVLGAFPLRKKKKAGIEFSLEAAFKLFPRLAERRKQIASTLSGGERQMLALARALMSRPTLLLLDEPSLGLAPRIVRDVFESISLLRSSGISVLLVEQNARAALRLADYGYVLENGLVTLEGPANELAVDRRVTETYLGLGAEKRR